LSDDDNIWQGAEDSDDDHEVKTVSASAKRRRVDPVPKWKDAVGVRARDDPLEAVDELVRLWTNVEV